MPTPTLEQTVRTAMERHGHGKPPLCDECNSMYALLRAADAELAVGREARELLRQICGRAAVWNGHRELELTADGRRWLSNHPPATEGEA